MSSLSPLPTFSEAGVQLHAKLISAAQAAGHPITPTPLLKRVLRRTATDFADVIVDGRCATGTRQVGSAAAVWVHNNTASRAAVAAAAAAAAGGGGGGGAGASGASPPGSGGAGSGPSSPKPSAGDSAQPTAPLYCSEAALAECRMLLATYTMHCLLSAGQETAANSSGANGASSVPVTTSTTSATAAAAAVRADDEGRVAQLPLAARNWAPEVSLVLAETEASAEELHQLCVALAEACGVRVRVVLHTGSKAPASLVLSPDAAAAVAAAAAAAVTTTPITTTTTTQTVEDTVKSIGDTPKSKTSATTTNATGNGTSTSSIDTIDSSTTTTTNAADSASTPSAEASATANPAEAAEKDAAAAASTAAPPSPTTTTATATTATTVECPFAASIIIVPVQDFLSWNINALLNAGVDVAVWDGTQDSSKDGAAAVAASATTATAAVAGAAPPWTRRVYPHIASIVVEEIGSASVTCPAGMDKALQQWRELHHTLYAAVLRQNPRYAPAVHLHPHYLWVCRGPISQLPPPLRQCLSRRSRRYYQLQPSTYISPVAVALMPHPHEGLSSPAESLGVRIVLSQNQPDKESQLRRIITDRSGLYHRVLLLTHNKEVAQLTALITSWGVSKEAPTASSATTNSPNCIISTRRMDSLGAQQQCQASYMLSCEAAERAVAPKAAAAGAAGAATGPPASSPVVVTLIAWDALTSIDVMDVDIIIQYYPPQKSLTEQEWAEFIQILHTTVNGEREIELSLRQNRNNKEDNIQAKLQQLREGTTTTPAASTPRRAAPQRPLPVLVTMMVSADFTLSAYFLHQYMYSGATGTLTRAAIATSLTSTGPAPGRPGAQEPVEHPLPVFDIAAKHPYFIPLVCGHAGDAEWPASALGAPPQPRTSTAGMNGAEATLIATLTSGEPVNVKRVLAAKLLKEQQLMEPSSGATDTAATSPNTAAGVTSSSTNSSATPAVPSPVHLLAQGNVTPSAGAASSGGGNQSGSSGNNGGGSARRANSMERQTFAKLVKNAGVVAPAATNSAANARQPPLPRGSLPSSTGPAAGGSKEGGSSSPAAAGSSPSPSSNNTNAGGNGAHGRNARGGGGGGGGGTQHAAAGRGGKEAANGSPTTAAAANSVKTAGGASASPSPPAPASAAAASASGTNSSSAGRGGNEGRREADKGSGSAGKSGPPSPPTAASRDAAASSGGGAGSGSGSGTEVTKSGAAKRRARNARAKSNKVQAAAPATS